MAYSDFGSELTVTGDGAIRVGLYPDADHWCGLKFSEDGRLSFLYERMDGVEAHLVAPRTRPGFRAPSCTEGEAVVLTVEDGAAVYVGRLGRWMPTRLSHCDLSAGCPAEVSRIADMAQQPRDAVAPHATGLSLCGAEIPLTEEEIRMLETFRRMMEAGVNFAHGESLSEPDTDGPQTQGQREHSDGAASLPEKK